MDTPGGHGEARKPKAASDPISTKNLITSVGNPMDQSNPMERSVFSALSFFSSRATNRRQSASILIETEYPDDRNPEQQPVDRLSYHTANGKGVLMFNKVIANHAHQFVYAPQTEEFEQLLKAT